MPTDSKKSQTQTRLSRCDTHGTVEGTRQLPKLGFPFLITGPKRLVAMAAAFRCPQCGAKTARA
jgi:hypothetical protein